VKIERDRPTPKSPKVNFTSHSKGFFGFFSVLFLLRRELPTMNLHKMIGNEKLIIKLKIVSLLALLLFAAGCSKEAVKETPVKEAVNDETLNAAKVADFQTADLTNMKEAVPALASELNRILDEVKWPTELANFYNRPISSATLSKNEFHMLLSLEDTTDRPLNLYISNEVDKYQESQKNGYTTQNDGEIEYLVSPKQNEIIFVDGEFLYQLDTISTLMDYKGDILSIEELLAIAKGMTTDSKYKEFFNVDLEVYNLPTYFTNDGNESYSMTVGYNGDGSYFDPETQTLQVGNDSAIFEQSALDTPYEPIADELNIEDGLTGYLSFGFDGLFELPNGNRLFTLRLATESVKETTGTVSFVEIPNWDEEVTKIIKSLKLTPQQDEVSIIEDTTDSEQTELQKREMKHRIDSIERVYRDSVLDHSVFDETALKFVYLGPEISVGYIQEQLSKRYYKVNKDIEKLKINNLTYGEMSTEASNRIQELVEYNHPSEIYFMKDEYKGEHTLYWILQMDNSVEGYKVLNVYDADEEMVLSDY
jgi:hypothetical protein